MGVEGRDLVLGLVLDGLDGELLLALRDWKGRVSSGFIVMEGVYANGSYLIFLLVLAHVGWLVWG